MFFNAKHIEMFPQISFRKISNVLKLLTKTPTE